MYHYVDKLHTVGVVYLTSAQVLSSCHFVIHFQWCVINNYWERYSKWKCAESSNGVVICSGWSLLSEMKNLPFLDCCRLSDSTVLYKSKYSRCCTSAQALLILRFPFIDKVVAVEGGVRGSFLVSSPALQRARTSPAPRLQINWIQIGGWGSGIENRTSFAFYRSLYTYIRVCKTPAKY